MGTSPSLKSALSDKLSPASPIILTLDSSTAVNVKWYLSGSSPLETRHGVNKACFWNASTRCSVFALMAFMMKSSLCLGYFFNRHMIYFSIYWTKKLLAERNWSKKILCTRFIQQFFLPNKYAASFSYLQSNYFLTSMIHSSDHVCKKWSQLWTAAKWETQCQLISYSNNCKMFLQLIYSLLLPFSSPGCLRFLILIV